MHTDYLAASYGISAATSLLILLLLIRSKRLGTHAFLFFVTLAFGVLVFPYLAGILQSIEWRLRDTDGTMTFHFVEKSVDPSWSNPEYWATRIDSYSSKFWWVFWPAYFGILYVLAKIANAVSDT